MACGASNHRARRRADCVEQIPAFLETSYEMEFEAVGREKIYEWMRKLSCEQLFLKAKAPNAAKCDREPTIRVHGRG